MGRYKNSTKAELADDGNDSEYESDGETTYYPKKFLGHGTYAHARLFKSQFCPDPDSSKQVVVLHSAKNPEDKGEAFIKHKFFQTLYPQNQSHLFNTKNGYRLVIPHISCTPYEELPADTPEFQRTLFYSAVQALKDCHEKGMVVIDLKADNIYYDADTKKSFLIDGGLSATIGTPIDPLAFQQSSQKLVYLNRLRYEHIPPECWSVAPSKVLADRAMDVYSLGVLMNDVLDDAAPKLQGLIDWCLAKKPKKRPTLEELTHLLTLLNESACSSTVRGR